MEGEDAGGRAPANFPANLKVLLVDDDRSSLVMLKKMLEDCSYHVIACQSGEEALETLRNSEDGFDIVMSDVRMPGIDGLQLLAEIVTMKIDSPVILFSDEPENDAIWKGVHGGACDFLAKPIHISTLKIIWKYLLHKISPDTPITSLVLHSDQQISQSNEQPDYNAMKGKRGGDSFDSSSIKETEQVDQSNVAEAETATKKPRMSWKPEAHNAFLEAIASVAPEKPLPKNIQEYMETKHGISGLTRQIISSHLQKHRENMKKIPGIPCDPRIGKRATTTYGIRAPPPLPPHNLSSISWETSSRHQAPTAQVYPQLVGTPTQAELGFLNENAKRYVRQLPLYRRPSFTEKFPHVHPAAIDLVEKTLTFDHRLGITLEDALAHPYLNSLHDISNEPICMTPFSFDFEQNALSEEQMKELIHQEALAFNPEYQ